MASNDWLEYKKLFEQTLERLESIQDDLTQLKLEVATVKARNSIFFGFLGGTLPFLAEFLIRVISSGSRPS